MEMWQADYKMNSFWGAATASLGILQFAEQFYLWQRYSTNIDALGKYSHPPGLRVLSERPEMA